VSTTEVRGRLDPEGRLDQQGPKTIQIVCHHAVRPPRSDDFSGPGCLLPMDKVQHTPGRPCIIRGLRSEVWPIVGVLWTSSEYAM
jgi:hypothetical protein